MAEPIIRFCGCAARIVYAGSAARDSCDFERRLRRLGLISFFGRRIVLDTGEVSYDVLAAVLDPSGYGGKKASVAGLLRLLVLVEPAVDVLLVALSMRGEEHEFVVSHVNQLCGLDSVDECFGDLDRQLGLTCRGPVSSSFPVEEWFVDGCSEASAGKGLQVLLGSMRIKVDRMVQSVGVEEAEERMKAAIEMREEQFRLKEEQVRLTSAAVEAQAERVRLAELRLIESVRKDMSRDRRANA